MSSFSALARKGLIALALSGTLVLAGCSGFRPVYGEHGLASERMELAYAKPASRLEQVIYQEFVLRFGRSQSPDAPRLTVHTSVAGRELTTTANTGAALRPATQNAVTVTGTAVLTTADGEEIFSGSRSATAHYASVGQVLADTEAANEAQERAAKEVAEGLRLAILGKLATYAPGQ